MRINPIINRRNINFGKFADKKTESLTKKIIEKQYDGYFNEKALGKEEYQYATQYRKNAMEYFRLSPLFTIQRTENKRSPDKDVVYIAMNQDEIDKHEHKELFKERIEFCRENYDPILDISDEQLDELRKKPDFYKVIEDHCQVEDFYYDMQDMEEGKRSSVFDLDDEDESRSTEPRDSEYEEGYQKLKDFMIYGISL